MPGQKSIRLATKGRGSSFPDAGFRRFRPAIPWPPRLFAEAKRREQGRLLPALFGFGACFLARQQENGSEQTTNLEIIQAGIICSLYLLGRPGRGWEAGPRPYGKPPGPKRWAGMGGALSRDFSAKRGVVTTLRIQDLLG